MTDLQERGRSLLAEREALIVRTEAFDRRWWRIAKACHYSSQTLTVSAAGLFLASLSFSLNWPQWPAWSALMLGLAFGWGRSWAGGRAIKRRLAATYEPCAINDRMRAETNEIFARIGLDPL